MSNFSLLITVELEYWFHGGLSFLLNVRFMKAETKFYAFHVFVNEISIATADQSVLILSPCLLNLQFIVTFSPSKTIKRCFCLWFDNIRGTDPLPQRTGSAM